MAELAIHDPHYLNVESDQKTAIVHLFHNPIPADGHRDEGPEWAREVDDIYLIGGVGPDGPTVKTVTNGEATEWSAGATYAYIRLNNSRADAFSIDFVKWILGISAYSVKTISFATHSEHTIDNCMVSDNAITIKVANKSNITFLYNNIPLVTNHVAIGNTDYYKVTLPTDYYDTDIPIVMS